MRVRGADFPIFHVFHKVACVCGLLVCCYVSGALAQNVSPAAQENIQIIVATDSITIGTDFTGADLYIAGMVENADPLVYRQNRYNVVVTLEGAARLMIMREKKRRLGLWVNADSTIFYNVPLYYALASTGELRDITTAQGFHDLGLGIADLPLRSDEPDAQKITTFREELVRLKRAQNLYSENIGAVTFTQTSLFRARFQLPTNLPVGRYQVNAYLFRDGAYRSHASEQLDIRKAQLTDSIFYAAHQYSLWYGIAAVLIAIITGLTGRFILRRD